MSKKAIVYSLISLFLFQPWTKELNATSGTKYLRHSIHQQQYAVGFDAIIEQTIDYLQGLEIELISFAQKAHEKDLIMAAICTEIPSLFDRNEDNAYALKTYLSKSLEGQTIAIFNKKETIAVSIFCQALAEKCHAMILEFKNTDIRTLKKKYGANIARYKISQYPSIKLVLLYIYNQIKQYTPPPPPAITDQELTLWQTNFQEKLDLFKTKNATQFFRKDVLVKKFDKIQQLASGHELQLDKKYLIDPIIPQLGDKKIWEVPIVIQWIEKEIPNLALELKKRSSEPSFRKIDYPVLMDSRIDLYVNMLKYSLVEDHFTEYESTVKNWVDKIHKYLIGESQQSKNTVYNRKLLSFHLSKLFRGQDALLNLEELYQPIRKTLKTKEIEIKGEEVHQLLQQQINPMLYNSLRERYQKAAETTTDDWALDILVMTLETSLPRVRAIKHAISQAKQ